jgi:hypothetical protein
MSREPWMAGATARVYCDNCGHNYLLAFSALAPASLYLQHPCCRPARPATSAPVASRNGCLPTVNGCKNQYVFALPKLLWLWFRHDRTHFKIKGSDPLILFVVEDDNNYPFI